MKKIMIMAAAVMMSLAANAQTSPEAKAIKKLKTYAEADAAFKASGAAMTPEDQAFCYNRLAELANKEYDAAEANSVSAQLKKDEAAMAEANATKYVAAYNALSNAKSAFDLNQKSMKIGGQLQGLRAALVNAGLEAFNSKNYADAEKYFSLYVDAKNDPLFSKVDFSKETGYGQVAYYAGLASYFNKDFKKAKDYTILALDQKEGSIEGDAITLIAGAIEGQMKNNEIDSVAYAESFKELYQKYPENEVIFGKIIAVYQEMGDNATADKILKDRLQQNPNDVMALAYVAQNAQNDSKWEEAISAYEKALAAKPDFIQCKLNLAVCYLTRGANVYDSKADARGVVPEDVKASVIADFNKSKSLLEEVKTQDPDELEVKWSYQMQRVDYALEQVK